MFGDDADSEEMHTQLVSSWGNNESLITALIAYGSGNKSNESGIYNTVVLSSNMQSDTIMKKKIRDTKKERGQALQFTLCEM